MLAFSFFYTFLQPFDIISFIYATHLIIFRIFCHTFLSFLQYVCYNHPCMTNLSEGIAT